MSNEFTTTFEKEGEWFIASSPEVPEANGQGKTKEEALRSLSQAIKLVFDDCREDGLLGIAPDALVETINVAVKSRE